MERAGPGNKKLSQSELSRLSGVPQATISRILKGAGKKGPESTTVKKLADACGVVFEWLNEGTGPMHRHKITPESSLDSGRLLSDTSKEAGNGEIEIPQYKGMGGAMGNGVTLRDQPGEIHGWRVTPEWISKNIKNHSGTGNLCIVTGFGNSMQPLYNPGDPLILDRGIKSVEFDATYFFRVGNEGFIKILQRIPGEGIRVISKNKDYETWTIKPDMDFEVFGQVLKAWCGTDV